MNIFQKILLGTNLLNPVKSLILGGTETVVSDLDDDNGKVSVGSYMIRKY